MAKTLIKMAVAVVILAALVFFGLQYWEQQKKEAKPTVPETEGTVEVVSTMVKSMDVTPQGESALTVQIAEVPGPGSYRISLLDRPTAKLIVDISGAKMSVSPSRIDQPHELIESIIASPSFAQGTPVVRIEMSLNSDISFQERLMGTTLTLDIQEKAEIAQTEEAVQETPKPKPTPRKVVKTKKPAPKVTKKRTPPKPAPRKKVVKRPTRRSTPKPVRTRRPVRTRQPEPVATPDDSDDLLAALGIDDEPEPMATPEPVATPRRVATPEPEPVPQEDFGVPSLEPPSTGGGSDAEFEEAPLEQPLDFEAFFPEEEATPEATPRVAAIPKEDVGDGRFDAQQVMEDMPAIQNISVSGQGGMTTVRIERDKATPYKIFRLVNPTRLVVDFKDTKSKVGKSSAGAPGTKIRKYESKEFVSKGGTISRVTFYLDGPPKYRKSLEGSTLIIQLPK